MVDIVSLATSQRFGFEPEICILDVETTGFNPQVEDIIEIAIVRMDGPDIIDRFSTFIKPRKPIPEFITKLTSITNEDVADAPTIDEVVPRIRAFVGDTAILAHNASFDRSFIEHACGELPGPWLDSVELTRIAFPSLRHHNQDALVAEFLPEKTEGLHRALHDVEALTHLWRLSLSTISTFDLAVLHAMGRVASPQGWPLGEWIARIANYRQGLQGTSAPKSLDLRAVRSKQVKPDKQDDFEDAYEYPTLSFPEFTEIVEALSADGIAGRMYPAFEKRQEQIDMAVEVNDAFAVSRHLAIEAGTGVGKSLAYLVPAAMIAQRNKITIGIGTKTNTLTDQIMTKELPLLNEALGGGLRYTALKGYENYLCLNKLENQLRESDLEPYEICVALAWVATHPWGDLESMNFYWNPAIRWVLNARSLECSRRSCRFYPQLCYVHGPRIRARSSHIVVTNHALLFRDAASSGALLPPLRYVILDEAHGVEGEARRQLAITVASDELLRELEQFRRPHSGLINQIKRNAAKAGALQEEVLSTLTAFEMHLNQVYGEVIDFIDAVRNLLPPARSQEYASTEVWIDPDLRVSAQWAQVAGVGQRLQESINRSLVEGRGLITLFEQQDDKPPQSVADFSRALIGWAAFGVGLEEVLGPEQDNVYYSASFYTPRNRSRQPVASLNAANIEMGSLIAEGLLGSSNSVVFTSATLAASDGFDAFNHAVGFDVLGQEAYQSMQLPSSFDLDRQMRIFIINDIEAPNESGYREQLEKFLHDLHIVMAGGVLTLFTNRSDLQSLHDKLEGRLARHDLPLLAQSAKVGRKHIAERFVQETNASLFATKSFWEGFDAIGETLRGVVIARIPFSQPSDPLALARKSIDTRYWENFVLPEAIVDLRQAIGRLIRSSTDEGIVIIADSRAAHARYASKIQAALPVEPIIASRADILRMIGDR